MATRAYILSFDRNDEIDYVEFHNKLTTLPGITTWSHYLMSSYILITDITNATTLNNEIIKLLPPLKSILLIEVNLKNRNGKLVQSAWDWFNKVEKLT